MPVPGDEMEENCFCVLGQFKAPFQVVALIAEPTEPRFHPLCPQAHCHCNRRWWRWMDEKC